MTDRKTLEALLKRVEEAGGEDRGLDGLIARDLLGWLPYFDLSGDYLLEWPDMGGHWHLPGDPCDHRHHVDEEHNPDPAEFTASVDDALELVERLLPGAILGMKGPRWKVSLWTARVGYHETEWHITLSLAILAALLKALIGQTEPVTA